MNNVEIGKYGKRLVQIFWDPEPLNNADSELPIWCLGRSYESEALAVQSGGHPDLELAPTPSASSAAVDAARPRPRASSTSSVFEEVSKDDVVGDEACSAGKAGQEQRPRWPASFLDDFESRAWLTYRTNFSPIAKSADPKAASLMSFSVRLKSQLVHSGFTSDTGWGCMIRSGQSLLANALVISKLGRDWTRATPNIEERRILALFADDPRAPFSIHRFVEHGASACGTFPGQWFGPSATAKCIQALSEDRGTESLRVYVTGDGPDVFQDELFGIAKAGSSTFKPTLMLVGTKLGIDRVTPVYWDALKASLQMPQSMGIAGGRPSSSHYFVGCQGSNFFYLDPHHPRPALPFYERPEQYSEDDIDSCHTRRLRRLAIEDMDPSMLIAFLFQDESDWRSWREAVAATPGKAIFHIADSQSARYGYGSGRENAVDEVETFDDDDDDDDDDRNGYPK